MKKEFEQIKYEVERMIFSIEQIGIDTFKYKQKLTNIIYEVEDNLKKHQNPESMTNMFIEQSYTNGLKKIKSLQYELTKYDDSFKIMNTCQFIDSKIQKPCNEEELKQYAKEINHILKSIELSFDIYQKNELEIIYNIAYKIIKLEILTYRDSYIYDYCKNNNINVAYFNQLIEQELSKINLEDDNNHLLKERIYILKSQGLISNYFDYELIKLLCYEQNPIFKEKNIQSLISLSNKIKNNNQTILEKIENNNQLSEYLTKTKKNIKTKRLKNIKKIISLITSLIVTITIGINLHNQNKKQSTKNVYEKITITYNGTEHLDRDKTIVTSKQKPKNEINVKEYEPWQINENNETVRTVNVYDMTHTILTDLSIYPSINTDETIKESYEEKMTDETIIKNYDTPYKEVEGIIYNKTDKTKVDYQELLTKDFFYFLILSFILNILSKINTNQTTGEIIIKKIKNISNDIINLYQDKKQLPKKEKELLEKINELLILINDNEELKSEFSKIFEENKHLLYDPDNLYQRVYNLENQFKINLYTKNIKTKKLTQE